MRRAVVLAAGDGGRLGAHTLALPKALIRVGGKPMIQHTLEGLAAAGVREVAVVGGYRGAELERGLREGASPLRYLFIDNPRFGQGASFSLRAGREWVGPEPFLLVMADHLLSGDLLRRLVAGSGHVPAVGADFAPAAFQDVVEATRLRVDHNDRRAVTGIGKHIEPWDALDTGAFALTAEVWEAVDEEPEDCELSEVFQRLAARGLLVAVDVSGAFWFDVDTGADLALAEDLVRGQSGRGVA
jgi:choline kinase